MAKIQSLIIVCLFVCILFASNTIMCAEGSRIVGVSTSCSSTIGAHCIIDGKIGRCWKCFKGPELKCLPKGFGCIAPPQ
ncbi:hypothetical protein MKW94_013677 [Papaver nudicaule]|uniref:Uncharacterized protein n=1 Tax=Papaver nudicaule TaxID=74823 RepID=A0AA41VUT7_PAPNU|nr:hypothetical protein [Papaver nudicaule]